MGLLRRNWLTTLLAILAGSLVTLALAPFSLWPLALVAAAGLYLLLQPANSKQAIWLGWCFGFGLFASGTSWVYVSIHDYGAASPMLAGFLTLLFISGLALLVAGQAWLWVRWLRQPQHGLINAFAFAGLWVLAEFFRGWFLTGFPWLYLGYSQLQGPFSGLVPVGGVWLASFMLVLLAVLIAQLVFSAQARRSWHSYGLLSFMLVAASTPLNLVRWTAASGSELSVLAVQGNIEQNLKWEPEQLSQQLRLYHKLTLDSARADLIVWPETAVPVLKDSVADYLQVLASLAQQRQAALITGVPMRQPDSNGRMRYYNAITAMGNGEGDYLKQKLVPFGEYVPLQEVLRGLIEFFDLPMSDFARGPANQLPLQANGYQVAPYICYEVVYPEFARKLAAHSDILLTISNDTWFGRSIGPLQHLQMAQMRALESGRWMIRATNNGVTALIDPRGQITNSLPQFEQAVLNGKVQPMQGLTPYLRFGFWPLSLLSLALCAVAALARAKDASSK